MSTKPHISVHAIRVIRIVHEHQTPFFQIAFFLGAKIDPLRRGILSVQSHLTTREERKFAASDFILESILRVFPCLHTNVPEGWIHSSIPVCVVSAFRCGRVLFLISGAPK